MVRHYERKTVKGTFSSHIMKEALDLVLKGHSIRSAAKQKGLNYKTLGRYFKKLDGKSEVPENLNLTSTFDHRSVFSLDKEKELASYARERSQLGYGMTALELRSLAYDLAKHNQLKIPKSWEVHQQAGEDWFSGFMKRDHQLSLRTAEQCSLARAAAFNKPNIENYFKKLESVKSRNPHFGDGTRIFNCDETGTSTVGIERRKVIAPKGVKQVHQIKSQERGTTVTTLFFIGAAGLVLPPVMIFPRKNFNRGMLKDCYPNTLGLASPSGWMNKEMFVPSLNHFIKFANCSKENPALLIVDNVEAHLSVEAITLCKENGVTLFTLPPHTTHKTQPLDVGVYGPFKSAYDHAIHLWHVNHPGQNVTIYDVAGFVNVATCAAMTPSNIFSAFKSTGIHPFNDKVFPETDFVKSQVTELPPPQETAEEPPQLQEIPVDGNNNAETEENVAVAPNQVIQPSLQSQTKNVSPSDILPLPKVVPKVTTRKPRRKGKCMVATDTPEKMEIEMRDQEKKKKEAEKIARATKRKEKQASSNAQKRKRSTSTKRQNKKVNRELFESSSEDEEQVDDVDMIATSDLSDSVEEEESEAPDLNSFKPLERNPKEGEYVLVEFTRKDTVYYIGKILSDIDSDDDFEISYLRKVNNKFTLPNVPDLKSVKKNDIKLILPRPTVSGTRRQQDQLHFDVDLSLLKVM